MLRMPSVLALGLFWLMHPASRKMRSSADQLGGRVASIPCAPGFGAAQEVRKATDKQTSKERNKSTNKQKRKQHTNQLTNKPNKRPAKHRVEKQHEATLVSLRAVNLKPYISGIPL